MCEILYCTMNKGSNALYVKGVESGICVFYTTLYTEYRFNGTHAEDVKSVLCIQGPSPLQEGRLPASHPVGLAVHQSE